MKKFFLFAAAAIAAMTVNAASFVGFDATASALGEQIAAGLATDQVNVTFVETSEGKYSVNLVTGGTEGSFKFGGVQFAYTNSADGATAYKTYGTYIQPNGKDREIRIPAKAGENVKIILSEACAGVLVNEVSTDFVAGENILAGTANGIVLKTVSTKPKIQAILPTDETPGGDTPGGDTPGGDTPAAGSFDGFLAVEGNLGAQIAAGLATDQVNVTFVETSEGKYSVNLVAGGSEGSFKFGGVQFAYTNSADGATAYKTYGTYIQPNGKDREIRIPAKAGEQVKIILVEACAGVLVDEVSTDFAAGETILTATKDVIVLKTVSTKPKIQGILPAGGEQGFEEILVAPKATKMVYNGQVVIVKEGRMFNLLGAEIMK